MKNFPVEVQLDILKFFDYKQLNSFQLITKQLNKLINKYNNELTLKGFFSFEMIPDTKVFLAERNKAFDIGKYFEKKDGNGIIYNFELNDSQKIKWENALASNVPLFVCPYAKKRSQDFIKDTYLLFIKRKAPPCNDIKREFDEKIKNFESNIEEIERLRINMLITYSKIEYYQKQRKYITENLSATLNPDRYRQLCLELPVYPKNIDELKFIRFWLFQLSRCCFIYINFENVIFNPEMLKITFEDSDNFRLMMILKN
uniref:F-box domain-containing protein n=1 Tax=Meloidogyne hapla TaxID=6305 RepID=A0A1I8BEV1_MELHA